jgi:CSLREA domain-containing protein
MLFGLLAAVAAWGSVASAAVIPVTTTADELTVNGRCSVREAIRAANLDVALDSCPAGSAAVQDIVRIPAGTYILGLAPAGDDVGASGDLDVLGSVSIFGVGQGRTIIDGGALDRVFEIHGGPTVAMARLTIRNGLAAVGGGMQIGGSAKVGLARVTIRNNTADDGGGVLVLSSGSLSVRHSVIRDNTARGAGGQGGGILLSNVSHVSLTKTTVRGNIAAGTIPSAGGGISSFGTLAVIQSKIQANTASNGGGGGIFSDGTATIRRSTLSGNVAALDGGGLSSMSPLTVVNSTFAGNTAQLSGGGLFNNGGALALRNATIARNSAVGGQGGGLANWNPVVTATLKNSILGRNIAGGGSPDCYGTILSQGRNLIQNTSGCTGPSATDIVGRGPGLAALAQNGGFAPTLRLRPSSRARDAGLGCARTDERGVPRPQGRGCDIGAYELAFCGGHVVNVVGTPGRDRLVGTSGADGILGLRGPDRLVGRRGNDFLCGGAGRDVLLGGRGQDLLLGGAGRDTCNGGPGPDSAAGCERTISLSRR